MSEIKMKIGNIEITIVDDEHFDNPDLVESMRNEKIYRTGYQISGSDRL